MFRYKFTAHLAAALLLMASTASPSAEPLATCVACHGADGTSVTPLTPSLGGQPAFYALTQLFLFREGRRNDPAMTEVAKGMSNDDMQMLADAIAKLPPPEPPATPAEAARFARGRALAKQNRCNVCHNPNFTGTDQVPRLAHQREDYLLKVLRAFKSGQRIGYGGAAMGMADAVARLSDADLIDLAHFLAYVKQEELAADRLNR